MSKAKKIATQENNKLLKEEKAAKQKASASDEISGKRVRVKKKLSDDFVTSESECENKNNKENSPKRQKTTSGFGLKQRAKDTKSKAINSASKQVGTEILSRVASPLSSTTNINHPFLMLSREKVTPSLEEMNEITSTEKSPKIILNQTIASPQQTSKNVAGIMTDIVESSFTPESHNKSTSSTLESPKPSSTPSTKNSLMPSSVKEIPLTPKNSSTHNKYQTNAHQTEQPKKAFAASLPPANQVTLPNNLTPVSDISPNMSTSTANLLSQQTTASMSPNQVQSSSLLSSVTAPKQLNQTPTYSMFQNYIEGLFRGVSLPGGMPYQDSYLAQLLPDGLASSSQLPVNHTADHPAPTSRNSSDSKRMSAAMEAINECMPSVTHQPMQSQTSSLSSTTAAFQHHPSWESPTYQTLSAVHCSSCKNCEHYKQETEELKLKLVSLEESYKEHVEHLENKIASLDGSNQPPAPSQEVLQFMQLYSQYYSTEGSNASSKSGPSLFECGSSIQARPMLPAGSQGEPFELGTGSGVFIGAITIKSIHLAANGDPAVLFRRLLKHMFGRETLGRSTSRQPGKNGEQPLDQNVLNAIKNYTYSYGVQHNLQGKCTDDRLERMLRNKLQTEKDRLKSSLDKSTKGVKKSRKTYTSNDAKDSADC